MSLHQDKNEQDYSAPIVSVSLGLPAVFLFGGEARSDRPLRDSHWRMVMLLFGEDRPACAITVWHRSRMGNIRCSDGAGSI